jgi:Ser/Thr protein kinase RdoA (MazF antagonist)
LGEGHINDTFLVSLEGDRTNSYVLQCLNRQVFPQPELIMANLRVLADHLDCRLRDEVHKHFESWQVIRPISAADGRDYFIDSDNNFWRLLSYVSGAASFDRVRDGDHAKEAGRALGFFHRLVWDLDPGLLADTLPGFHVTPKYLADYDRVLRQPVRQISSVDEEYCVRTIEGQRSFVPVLEDAARNGLLSVRVIHGDPKLANIMFDEKSGRAVSMVDLDTVKPGLLHYDIGDCLRSCCNPAGDNLENLGDVRFDIEICRNMLGGYLAEMAPLLTEAEYEFIYPAVKLITFELGLRFFTDHLEGDVYFKVDHSGHNLQRAMAQFRLMASIEESERLICNIVKDLRRDFGRGHDLRSM